MGKLEGVCIGRKVKKRLYPSAVSEVTKSNGLPVLFKDPNHRRQWGYTAVTIGGAFRA